MPKIEIDYSNTIFYKIYCRDPSINDLYIGHTTNFVQRKHAHKQSCLNTKNSNYNCKLYDVIRRNKGWDNWNMEIIAFHECDNLMSAKKYEQKYFEEYKATLNSIEPMPKLKPKISKVVVEKKTPNILYCHVCNIHLSSVKAQEIHNKTTKHLKKLSCQQHPTTNNTSKNIKLFNCKECDFICCKKGDYNRHILTSKHKLATSINNNNNIYIEKTSYICKNCNKEYQDRSGLWRHKKSCLNHQAQYTPSDLDKTNMAQKLIEIIMSKNKEIISEIVSTISQSNKDVMDKTIELMPNT
jgi:hypothetical protein